MTAVMLMNDKKQEFPLRGKSLISFVGWLSARLVTGDGPQLRAASLPNYVSGIRLTNQALELGELPVIKDSLPVSAVRAGHNKDADLELPPTAIQVRIPAHVLHAILLWATRPREAKQRSEERCHGSDSSNIRAKAERGPVDLVSAD